MKGYWDNLRPLEKRMVVGVATMFFVVLNAWFVFPHFSDWGRVQQRMGKAHTLLKMYQTNIAEIPKFEADIRKYQGAETSMIALDDQAGHFAEEIRSLAAGVTITSFPKISSRTNDAFFWEQIANISVVSKEQQLVDFLYHLGTADTLTRVRDLTLRPDLPARQQLTASMKLVASYQKRTSAKQGAPSTQPTSAKAAPPTTQPATNTAKAPVSTPKQPAVAAKPAVPPGKPATSTNKPPVSANKRK